MGTKVEKIVWITASMALMVLGFYYMSEIQKRIADRLYRKIK